jgi:katanin p60 ATPase-containing subunit A1
MQKFALELEGYSGSDIKLVCKEAAMKPLRRVMAELDSLQIQNEGKKVSWHKPVDPAQVPPLGQVSEQDLSSALSQTKAAAKVVRGERYLKWMEEFGAI